MTTADDARGRRRSLARGGSIGFVGSVFSAAMGFVLVIVLGTLGDYRSGVVLQAIAVYSIALGIARLGMDSAAVWIMPRLRATRSAATAKAAAFAIGAGASGGIAAALLMYLALGVLSGLGVWQPDVIDALAAITWTLPFASAFLAALATIRGLGGIVPYVAIGSIAVPALRPLGVMLASVLGGSVALITLGWAWPVVAAFGVALIVVRARLRRLESPEATNIADGPSLDKPRGAIIRYAGPRVISSSLEQLLLWLDVVIVGALAGAAEAGVYGTASRLIAATLIVDTAIRIVVSPEFSRLIHAQRKEELRQIYSTATVWLVLFSSPIIILLVVFAPLALSLVGEEFVRGAPVVAILGAGALITLLAGNIHSVLLMSGRSGWAATNKAVVVALNVVLLVLLVPSGGMLAAAAAWAACMMVDALLAWIEVRTLVGVRVGILDGVYPLLVSVITVAAPAILLRAVLGTTWPALILATLLGAALFGAWCWLDRSRLHLADLRSLGKPEKD